LLVEEGVARGAGHGFQLGVGVKRLQDVLHVATHGGEAELAQEVRAAGRGDLDRVHNALFDAQERVMTELSELRGTPSWQEVEQLFSETADPEFQEAV